MTTNTRYTKTAYLALCGLFAALTAICSYINIPLGFTPIPMNLATLAVFLSGGLLGKKYGPLSIGVYVLMGAAGIPVFAGFQAGVGVLAGPTGGYLIGYIASAAVVGVCLDTLPSYKRRFSLCMGSMAVGLSICYLTGTAWFMISTGTDLAPAIVACVLPFVPGDIIKIFIASFIIRRLFNNSSHNCL